MRHALAITALAAILAAPEAGFAADGAQIFATLCQACHQKGGVGVPGLAPPLVSPVLKNAASRQKDYPVMVVAKGLTGSLALAGGGTITGAMPPQQTLTDADIAGVVNYVFLLNHATARVKSADVARVRAATTPSNDDMKRLRQDLVK